MSDTYDLLKLENQICFPLYAASREITKAYKPFLDALDLTYTQYITMLALWEYEDITVSALGEKLYLDSGTLTPLLKKLEQKGLITRTRSKEDERIVIAGLTEQGTELKGKAVHVPEEIGKCVPLNMEEALQLKKLLDKILGMSKK